MTAVVRAIRTVLSQRANAPVCPPDCRFEYMCDSSDRYFRRECCYRPDCVYACGPWERIGAC